MHDSGRRYTTSSSVVEAAAAAAAAVAPPTPTTSDGRFPCDTNEPGGYRTRWRKLVRQHSTSRSMRCWFMGAASATTALMIAILGRIPTIRGYSMIHHHHHPSFHHCRVSWGDYGSFSSFCSPSPRTITTLRMTSSSTTNDDIRNMAPTDDAPLLSTEPLATTPLRTADEGAPTTMTTTTNLPKVRRIISGVQPTGVLHLGNYLGAIQQWVQLQNSATIVDATAAVPSSSDTPATAALRPTELFFCVVDLHAITVPQGPADLTQSTRTSAALYLAAGIDPSKSKIFVQSHVTAHAELTWLLQCMTPMNWLERMIQYKEKARKQGESVGAALFTYPVLMAADILLYQAEEIPVGEDQRQHLELARDLCRRFHDLYGKPANAYKKRMAAAGLSSRPVFTEPTAKYQTDGGARIMSLTDGTRKMSKSDPSDYSRINLLDAPSVIRDKIKKCKTDDVAGLEWDNPDRPEATNLLNIYAAVVPSAEDTTKAAILARVKDMTWGEFKPLLAEAIVQHLQPIQERYAAIRSDGDADLDVILADGAHAANAVASQTLNAAKIAMGLVVPLKSLSTGSNK